MILVVGADGQVGHALLRAAAARGVEARGLNRADLDITDADAVRRAVEVVRPAIIINAAAFTAVDRAERDTEAAFAINRDGAAHLAAACAARGAALVHLSTDYVFSGDGERPWREDDAPAPINRYGASKLAGEQAIAATLERALIVRTAWVFSARGANFVRTMLRLARERGEVSVVDDQWGGPTPAAALADTLIRACAAIAKGEVEWGIYHYSGAPYVSWHGFAAEIFDQAFACGLLKLRPQLEAITTTDYPTPAARPKNARLDCARWRQRFGDPTADWRVGLRDVLQEIAQGEAA